MINMSFLLGLNYSLSCSSVELKEATNQELLSKEKTLGGGGKHLQMLLLSSITFSPVFEVVKNK